MTITDTAKKLLKEALTASNSDCLIVKLQKSCCGTSVFLQTGKLSADDKAVMINDISFIMSEEAADRTKDIIIDAKDKELTMTDPKACSC